VNAPILRLTALAHGGGCGCKLSPAVLRELLAEQPASAPFASLLVGTETGDDAAVWRLDDETCIVATTDFFMPMVDDPFDFGRIAATNALSDVYAMGGKPIFALAVLGMPINTMPTAMIREILRGGAAMAAEAGIPVAGGHSIDSPEPIYGLAVVGLVSTKALRRNSEARPGRCADPHETARRRNLFGGDQEGRALRRRLSRDAWLHYASQHGRRRARARRGGSRDDRRHRLRPSRPFA
jgi:selenide, water dikinase